MKDRVARTNIKKPSHRLFRGMIAVSSLTVCFATLLGLVLFQVSSENKSLTQKIDTYTIQMEKLEKDETVLLKNTND